MPVEGSNPYSDFSDDALIGGAAAFGAKPDAMIGEITRRLKDSVVEQTRAAERLGNKLWWLNFWLLVFTVAIAAMTGALVWFTLRTGGLK
jgi:hypothetical protein